MKSTSSQPNNTESNINGDGKYRFEREKKSKSIFDKDQVFQDSQVIEIKMNRIRPLLQNYKIRKSKRVSSLQKQEETVISSSRQDQGKDGGGYEQRERGQKRQFSGNRIKITVINNVTNNFRVSQSQQRIKNRKIKLNSQFCIKSSRSHQKQAKMSSQDRRSQFSNRQPRPQQMNVGKIKFKHKDSLKEVTLHKSPLKIEANPSAFFNKDKSQLRYKPRLLHQYIGFITRRPNQQYSVGCDYEYIRKLKPSQIPSKIQFKHAKVLQSILLCVIDIFKKKPPYDNFMKNSEILLREYSNFYFKLSQKSQMQVVLMHHTFKLLKHRIFQVFVFMRLLFFYLSLLSEDQNVFTTSNFQKLYTITLLLYDCFHLIYTGFTQMQSNQQELSLKLLKISISTEIDKHLPLISQLFNAIHLNDNKPLMDITASMQFLLVEDINRFQHLQMEYLSQTEMILSWRYLRIPPVPFLPVLGNKEGNREGSHREFTLVISLHGVLVSYNQESRLLKYRPYLDKFLNKLKVAFEIILFSTQSKADSDQIINCIEKNDDMFAYRLYKEHMTFFKGKLIKDLTKLGRNVDKTLIIDCNQEIYCNCPHNGIHIKEYIDNKNDTQLLTLLTKLQKILKRPSENIIQSKRKEFQQLQRIPEREDEQNTISISK